MPPSRVSEVQGGELSEEDVASRWRGEREEVASTWGC